MFGTRNVVLNSGLHNKNYVKKEQKKIQEEDISLKISEIVEKEDSIKIPLIVADIIKDVIKDKTLPNGEAKNVSDEYHFTPFVYDPVFSGGDIHSHSNLNSSLVKEYDNTLIVNCVTTLLPSDDDIPIKIFFTGKEKKFPMEIQECTVEVKISDGKIRNMTGIVQFDKNGYPYIQVVNKGRNYEMSNPDLSITFCIKHTFPLIKTEN